MIMCVSKFCKSKTKKKIIYLLIFGYAGSSFPLGYSLVVVCGLLVPVASPVTENGLQGMRPSVFVTCQFNISAPGI